jgi:hypothetical protein
MATKPPRDNELEAILEKLGAPLETPDTERKYLTANRSMLLEDVRELKERLKQ